MEILTVKLIKANINVLARKSEFGIVPITYTNDTQANKKVQQLRSQGVDAEVYQSPMSRTRFIKIRCMDSLKSNYVTIWSRHVGSGHWLIERTHSVEYVKELLGTAIVGDKVVFGEREYLVWPEHKNPNRQQKLMALANKLIYRYEHLAKEVIAQKKLFRSYDAYCITLRKYQARLNYAQGVLLKCTVQS